MNDALAPVTQGDTLPELLANLKELGGCLFDSNLPLDRLVTRAADEKLFDLQFLDRSVLARTASCMPEINRITNALGRHMTQYMTYVISPASSFVPLRNVRQLLAEIEAKRMALAENLYKAQTSLVDLMELRDRSAEEARKENPDVYKLARMGIRQQQIQAELGNARVYYEGALKDLVHLTETYMKMKEDLGLDGWDEQDIEAAEETVHIVTAFEQAYGDMTSTGTISPGNNEYFRRIGIDPLYAMQDLQQDIKSRIGTPETSVAGLQDFLRRMVEKYVDCSRKVARLKGYRDILCEDALFLDRNGVKK